MQRRQVISSAGLGLLALAVEGGEAALADQAVITFLHFNDVYEISPQDGIGGFAEFMTLLDRERARHPNTITTFGGDLLSPSVMSGLTRGRQMIELADALGVQVAVVGNHEYDFGPELAEERIRAASFPWLGTNVLGPDGTPASGMVDLQLITVAGYKIGFFGVLTPATATLSQPGPAISFASPQAVAEAATRQLRRDGGRSGRGPDPSRRRRRPCARGVRRRHRSGARWSRPRADELVRARQADRQGGLRPALSDRGRSRGRPAQARQRQGRRLDSVLALRDDRAGPGRAAGAADRRPLERGARRHSWRSRSQRPWWRSTRAIRACAPARPISAISSPMPCATPPAPTSRSPTAAASAAIGSTRRGPC